MASPSPDDLGRFDLVIVGSGSGNTILDERFDGWRVAIVERGTFGGTCLNVGCIPTKMLVHPADLVAAIGAAGELGIDAHLDGIRWQDLRDRVFGRIDPIVADGARYRRTQSHVALVEGTARFVGPRALEVDGPGGVRRLDADRIVIAAGARPHLPDVPGLADVAPETSDTIMRRDEVPGRLLVIGGGFIAAELSHVFGAFGARVTIATRGPLLLSHHDTEIAEAATQVAASRFDLRLSTVAVRARRVGDEAEVELSDGTTVRADAVLVATGRIPNSDTLALGVAGIATHPDGRIRTDETLQTDVPGVWAIGDIRSRHMLKHVANHEARIVQHNLLHPDSPWSVREDQVPHAVFTLPQVAAVGRTEEELSAAGRRYRVGRRRYADTAAGWSYEDTSGFAKVLVDPDDGRILGAHLIGPHAAVALQPLVQAMRFGQTAEEVARGPMYPHPALSEVVEQALLDALDGPGG